MIRYVCGGCDTVLWSSSRLVGLPIKCEHCRFENVVPHESSDEMPRSRRRRVAPRPRPRTSMTPLVIGLVFVFSVVCVAVGFGVYAMKRGSAREDSLPLTFASKDGRSQLHAPGNWTDQTLDLDEQGELKVGHWDGGVHVTVRTELKVLLGEEMTHDRYAALAADRLTREVNGFLGGPRSMMVNGRRAIRYEVTGRVDGSPATFLLTVVEGREHFHQVVGVMIGEIDNDRNLLERIISTFREVR